jgi:two-component system response regulator MprA
MLTEARTVLVVDDNHDIRIALSDILEDEGYGVVHAENGLEALDKLRIGSPRPCLILLDLMMPKMDGAAFRRVQSTDPTIADIPVVIVSANLTRGQTAIPLNAAGALTKPFAATDLLDIVARLC